MSDLSGSMGASLSDELPGTPSQAERTSYDSIVRAQGRSQARGLADAMTGDSVPSSPEPQPRDTLLTRLLHAQGLLNPGALGSARPPTASPPVIVNVGTPDVISGAGPVAVRPPNAAPMPQAPSDGSPAPPPAPPISDELGGTPAYADDARLTAILRAQGKLPVQSATAPAQGSTSTPADPNEIEMFGDERDAAESVTPPSSNDSASPLPSVRERAREVQSRRGAPSVTPDESGAPPSGRNAPPTSVGSQRVGPVAPIDTNHSPHAMGFKRTLTAPERASIERTLSDPQSDPTERSEAQMQLDLDESHWAPVKASPPGTTPYVEDGNVVPNVYVDADGETRVATGDDARDARIRKFSDESDRERQLAHRDYGEKVLDPNGTLDQELERTGLRNEQEDEGVIRVNANRPDPHNIDARARRYVLQNEPGLPGGFSNALGQVDSRGQPTPPTDDDVAYRQGNLLDQGYRDSVESLARQRAVEEARQEQELPLRRKYDETSARVAQGRADALQEFTKNHRRYWDMAHQAQQAADAKYPNPDDLLGGKGSWTRAVALAIRAVGPSIGMSGTAALIDNQLKLEYAGRRAAYNKESARAEGAAMNAGMSLDSFKANDAAMVGQLAAAKERLADQFELLGAETADQAIQAKYQALSGRLKEDAAKSLGAFATQLANRDIKNSQLALTAAQIDERRREFDLKHSGAGYVIGTGRIEELPKDKRERAIPIPGGGYILAQNTQLANEANKQLAGTRQTVDHIDAVLAMTSNMPGWFDKVRAKARLEPADVMVIRNELQQAALSAKEAYKLGAISKSDADMLESLGADPGNVSKLNVTADKLEAVLKNWRSGMIRDAQNTATQFNTGDVRRIDLGQPPEGVRSRPASEYLELLSELPVIDREGAWMPARNGKPDHTKPFRSQADVEGIVDSMVESLDRDGVPWITPDPKRVGAKEVLTQAQANLMASQRKVRGEWLKMVQDREKMVRSRQVIGSDRNQAIDRVESSMKSLESGVTRLSTTISKRESEYQRQQYLDRTKGDRAIMRLPH